MENFKPSEQAVLEAISRLGHGNVHQITDSAGYARSTVDKALIVLRNVGLIVEYDTGADPAEGTPTQWQLADIEAASAPIGTNVESQPDPDTDEHLDDAVRDVPSAVEAEAGNESEDDDEDDEDDEDEDEDEDEDDEDEDEEEEEEEEEVQPARRAGHGRVMQIAGALVAYPDGATAKDLSEDTGIAENSLHRLLTAMVSGGAAVLLPAADGVPTRWRTGTARAAGIDPNPVTPRCELCQRTLPPTWTPPADDADANPNEGSRKPDHRVLTLAGAMIGYPDGVSAAELVAISGLSPEMAARCLSAMQRAEVAVRIADTSSQSGPLWIVKPGAALNRVDLDPKCSGCHRPLPGSRPSRSSRSAGGNGTRRPDALPRNVLKEATLRFILERPGIDLSPGAIAGALAVELNRDRISPGAVGNNCRTFAAEGKIRLVSDNPWLFSALPAAAEEVTGGEGTSAADDNASSSAADSTTDSTAQDTADHGTDHGEDVNMQ